MVCSDSDIWRAIAGVGAGGKQAKQFVLAGREGEGAAEQVEAVGGGCLPNGDDNGRATVFRRVWPVAGRKPGGPQERQKPPVRCVRAYAGWSSIPFSAARSWAATL